MKDEKKNKSKNPAAVMIITSLAYIVLGVLAVVFPEKANLMLCYALGAALTVYGLFNIISFFVDSDDKMYFELIVGIISAGFGIFALFSPDSIKALLYVPIGIVIIIDSIMDIKHIFTLKKLGMIKWWIPFLVSVAVIIFVLITIFLHLFGDLIMIALGIMLIYEGASGFALIILLSRYHKAFDRNRKMIEAEAVDVD